MAATSTSYMLYRTSDHSFFSDVESRGLDMLFPEDVRGWSDVLDCRIAPYSNQSLEENCLFAEHVRKYYILVTKDYAEKQA